MISEKQLIDFGFKKVENSNKYDFYGSLRLAFDLGRDVPASNEEEYYWEYRYSFDEVLSDYHKIDVKNKRNEYFDGFLKISFILDSQKYYFSFYFLDGTYCVLDTMSSYLLAHSIIEKSDSVSNKFEIHIDDDSESQSTLLNLLKTRLQKATNEDDVIYLENKICGVEQTLQLIENQDFEHDYFKQWPYEKKLCEVGVIDGFILLCKIIVNKEDYTSSFDDAFLAEVGPVVKNILKALNK